MTDIPNQELHRIATTAILFRDDGRVLITKRALHKKQWPGKWTVPGGGLETDDYAKRPPTNIGETNQWYNSIIYSLRREVKEEVGLVLIDPWLVCDLAFIRQDGTPVLVLSYAAEVVSDKDGFANVILDEDATNFAWVYLDEAQNYDLIDGIYHELELAFRERFMRKNKEK